MSMSLKPLGLAIALALLAACNQAAPAAETDAGVDAMAAAARHGDDWQVEAFNCVFHGLAKQHPQVCKFDLAYMEAATGRRVHHMECIVRGGNVCRFKIGPEGARS